MSALSRARLVRISDDRAVPLREDFLQKFLCRFHGSGPKHLRVRVENGSGNLLRIVTNGGRVLATAPVVAADQQLRFTFDLPVGAWVRADLFPADPETEMTAVSNPIYVDPQ